MSGLKRHFNAETTTGRANVAKVTYASIAMLYLIYRIKRKKTPKQTPAAATEKIGETTPLLIAPQHEHHFVAPLPPPHSDSQHKNNNNGGDHDHGHAHNSHTEGTHNGSEQHDSHDSHDKEKKNAADILAGAVSSHASKDATPSTNGGSCMGATRQS